MPSYPMSEGPILRDEELRAIVHLVYQKSGIALNDGKRALITARLQKRLRSGGFASFDDYLRHVKRDLTGEEIVHLLDAVATNHTSFFREAQHLDLLRARIVPEWLAREDGSPLAGWSVPCSSGEEPVSIVITLLEALPAPEDHRLDLLACDLSAKMVRVAKRGVYPIERVREIPRPVLQRYFERGLGEQEGLVRVAPAVRRRITYGRANLLEVGDLGRRFEFIFCRNVMIYFDRPVQQRVVAMLERHLAPGGYLFIGHSENLTGLSHSLQWVAPAVYRRRMW